MTAYNKFWNTLCTMKYKMDYCLYYQGFINKLGKSITTITAISSLTSIGFWAFWDKHPAVWAVILFVTQVIQIICLVSPPFTKAQPLKFSQNDLSKLFNDIEYDFAQISNKSDNEINKLRKTYEDTIAEIETKYLSDIDIIPIRYLEKKAKQRTLNHLDRYYNVEIEKE